MPNDDDFDPAAVLKSNRLWRSTFDHAHQGNEFGYFEALIQEGHRKGYLSNPEEEMTDEYDESTHAFWRHPKVFLTAATHNSACTITGCLAGLVFGVAASGCYWLLSETWGS